MIYRLALALTLALGLSACADGARELKRSADPLGNFKLGHAIVTSPNITQGPASRKATEEEWNAAMDAALEERFRRYEGDSFYHLGVSVEGFVLAQPGVPLVYSPKSVVIVRVTVFEDATGKKLNEEAEQITALEAPSAETVISSGLTQSKEEQMENLTKNVALQIEKWMRRMQKEKGWFGGLEANKTAPRVPGLPDPEAEAAEAAATADAGAASETASETAEGSTVMAAEIEPEVGATR